jgi:CheY-like chemotaxis protein
LETLQLDRYEDQTCSPFAAPPFDLIMLDLYLPRTTGLDLLRRIRTDPVFYLTPVVMFSCENDDAAATNCLEAGANAFVTKSTDSKTFRDSVTRIASFWATECYIPKLLVPAPK